jgi:hypothetical protein
VSNSSGRNSSVTFSGTTITGNGGVGGPGGGGGGFSGGDGGANGGGGETFGEGDASGGAVGGNGGYASCRRRIPTDVSGLFAAVTLAGGKTTEDCGSVGAFGYGGTTGKFITAKSPGYGGGGNSRWGAGTSSGAVVLYFS